MAGERQFPVYFPDHALTSMRKRGADRDEVIQTIREAEWCQAKHGRYEAEKEFPFDAAWNEKHYALKKVNPVFVVERDTIIIVTVYCFYH